MLRTASLIAVTSLASANTIFDDDHEFMKGFEYGVLSRNKGTSLEEFGCKVPEASDSTFMTIVENVSMALNTAKPFLPDDLEIEQNFEMLTTYLDGMTGLWTVLDPKTSGQLDDYCRGMVFGVNGWELVVKVATILRNQEKENIEMVPSKDGKR